MQGRVLEVFHREIRVSSAYYIHVLGLSLFHDSSSVSETAPLRVSLANTRQKKKPRFLVFEETMREQDPCPE